MEVKPHSLRAWFLAARPKTLTGAAAPVLIAGAMAAVQLHSVQVAFPFTPFFLCLLFAWVMQIAANFVNDWYDFKRGSDGEDRLGPKRACAQGWIAPRAMLYASCAAMAIAAAVGLPLVIYGGWTMLAIGAACLLFCVLYTTLFSYKGLGDILVVLFFGIVPVCVTFYLLTGSVTWQVVAVSAGTGLVVDTLLLVNNYRDRFTDEACGKRTIVVRLGGKWAERAYLLCGVAGVCSALPLYSCMEWWSLFVMLPYLYIHFNTWRMMVAIGKGKALNAVLGKTARNIFIFSLLLSVSLLAGMYL